MTERIVTTQPSDDDKAVEAALRPQTLAEYVGQARMKDALRICMDAAKQRKEALDHCIFYGPPGVGKTTIAHIIAREMGDRKSTRLNSSHLVISYAVFCLKKKK